MTNCHWQHNEDKEWDSRFCQFRLLKESQQPWENICTDVTFFLICFITKFCNVPLKKLQILKKNFSQTTFLLFLPSSWREESYWNELSKDKRFFCDIRRPQFKCCVAERTMIQPLLHFESIFAFHKPEKNVNTSHCFISSIRFIWLSFSSFLVVFILCENSLNSKQRQWRNDNLNSWL